MICSACSSTGQAGVRVQCSRWCHDSRGSWSMLPSITLLCRTPAPTALLLVDPQAAAIGPLCSPRLQRACLCVAQWLDPRTWRQSHSSPSLRRYSTLLTPNAPVKYATCQGFVASNTSRLQCPELPQSTAVQQQQLLFLWSSGATLIMQL
jgi:hypothetical protein